METPLYTALLCIQGTLGNSVTPQLRAVSLDIDEENYELLVYFYYDGELTEELDELFSIVLLEVDTYTEHDYFIRDSIYSLKVPEKIPVRGKFAFLRYESILPKFKKENRTFLLQEWPPIPVFCLDMQEALLGKVTPALRHVSVGMDIEKKKLIAHFIYDGEISEREFNLATAAIQESRKSFPEYEMDSLIERVDFPNRMPHRGDRLAYWRREITTNGM